MNKKERLLILYDWFYPGFLAGGPIQSLTNLAAILSAELEVYVITGAFDLNAEVPYSGVIINDWNDIHLPGSSKPVKVFYSNKAALNKEVVYRLLLHVAPDIVYLNGIFCYRFFLLPLQLLIKTYKNSKVVVAPRGMLKKGALSQKALKKKMYFRYLKYTGLLKQVCWHATNSEEAADIIAHFPVNKGVLVAPNIPKPPCSNVSFIDKKKGGLRLVYLSLINEHKNLLLLLQLIKKLDTEIHLDIYGPVVDETYWSSCQPLIREMPAKVQYKGPVEPVMVQEVLARYHALILLTKGENFGHAIYESLSVGRPVITSHFTPWQNLDEKSAGANVDIMDINACISKINDFVNMQQEEYDNFCAGALSAAKNYYSNLHPMEKYKLLFTM